ncbi:MAB_1171c family putative transporter [Actinopolyspora mortivallis]|uniref:MAB_1171c family putative transporter n=1 Tax=Actinopolyspora mortivallis TaxID=33906 RepID=UPI000378DA77|nr:MAB_1171c family putative transporter [Actinopolyspora mortivallis]
MASLLMWSTGLLALIAAGVRYHRATHRTPGVIHLSGAIASVGLSALLSSPHTLMLTAPVEPFPNATRLLANAFGMVGAWCVYGLLVHLVTDPPRAQTAVRRQAAVLGLSLVVMSLLLIRAPIPFDPDFVARFADEPTVLGYILIFCGYVAWILLAFVRLVHRYIRLSDRPWLRRGLRITQLGAVFGLAWAAGKTTVATAVFFRAGRTLGFESTVSTVTAAPCAALVAIGATMPSWGPALTASVRRVRHYHAYRVLTPMWETLSPVLAGHTHLPSAASQRPHPLDWRLTRRIVDLHDALLLLAPYRPSTPRSRESIPPATRRADPEAAHEAAAILEAVRAWHSGASPRTNVPDPPNTHPDDLAWLTRVSRALRHASPLAGDQNHERL